MKMFSCPKCEMQKNLDQFVVAIPHEFPLFSVCKKCLDDHFIEDKDCTCSVCKRKLPPSYFQHYRTRFKRNGMRLRVNTNCKDCSKRESSILSKIKKENPPPSYLTPCPQCGKICYEKVEDIPEGVNGTNGPWQCDHDHTNKEFRGYLCKRCNTGTGLIGDNVHYFRQALKRKKSR